jgi:adrenodoxin-NADP+ reductase
LQGEAINGLYVSGWLKRGPVGVIAATMYDAYETADSVLADFEKVGLPSSKAIGNDIIQKLLQDRAVTPVPFSGWQSIDRVELEFGSQLGKPREKLLTVKDMLAHVSS